jgi:GtrA-like protein
LPLYEASHSQRKGFNHPPNRFLLPAVQAVNALANFSLCCKWRCQYVVGISPIFISYKYILKEQTLHFGFFAFKAHIAALFMSFLINFPLGFFLMKYVVFVDSNLKGKMQLFRYFQLYIICLALNYGFLKLFVEIWKIYAPLAQILTTAIIVIFSYIIQRYYTFRKAEA